MARTKDVAYWLLAKRLSERLYIASYPITADKTKIEPLPIRANWEQDMWLRVAIEALETLEA